MSEEQEAAVYAALEKVFRSYNQDAGPANKDQRTADFVFHMTDWYGELASLWRAYQDPKALGAQEWDRVVAQFLYHAVGHLMAAAKLNDTFSDPFAAASASKAPRKRPSPSRR
jgi:hypothetical protein